MEYPELAANLSVNGMKRDVCVDEPDSYLPAGRFRPVFWNELAISVHTADARSYKLIAFQQPKLPAPFHAPTPELIL